MNLLIRRAKDRSSEYETGFVFLGEMVKGVATSSRRVAVRRVRVSRIWVSRLWEVARRAWILE